MLDISGQAVFVLDLYSSMWSFSYNCKDHRWLKPRLVCKQEAKSISKANYLLATFTIGHCRVKEQAAKLAERSASRARK